ncbi:MULTISPECIES: ABC transporter substrate-binding protein [Streptomyces]|uniref:ABC transporter substrate-binding protein n=1 Tax=Streptomyces koelreuteriae TaxID=2838015 RepID=A0ABX8G1Q2_9ACTN|nr:MULTISPECIES: ABC transporter substrate-binding protein [Streptomyces]QWB27258.1 ABC transporter substrate-binding protein [Streptomyces koelreuteriae]UUA10342.1 ABC transporter substrate-binding protein [Streptomyces koelreuteriae]UUA17949.1 ABC transporter substrate-binding protein [Streptomyces sp. CRCS-T-1]
MNRNSRGTVTCGLVVTGLLTAVGCSGADTATTGGSPVDAARLKLTPTTPAAQGPVAKVNWLLEDEPDSLDLDSQGSSAGRVVLTNVCERLYQLQPDMTVKPFLAEKATTPDGKTLVLKIRSGVTFHDGSKLTADDVLWSLKRHADPDMEQSDEFTNVSTMTKTGADEITVRFKQPDALFTKALAGDAGIVWNKEQVEKAGKEFGTPGQGDACSGPYELTGWKSGDSITIRAYDGYWGERPLTKEVVFRWASDSALVNALKTGAADGTFAESPNTASALRDAKGLSQYYGPSTATLDLIPTERGGLKDPRVRRAVSLTLDRAGIAKSGYGGLVQPWASPVGSGAWGYAKPEFAAAQKQLAAGAPASPDADDIAEAKKLVKEAGAPSAPIVIGTDASQGRTVVANALRAALQRIGLKGEIKTVPTTQFEEFYSDPQARTGIDVLVGDWYISKSDPMGFYDNGLSDSSNNWIGFKDAAYDKKVHQALSTLDDAQRAALAIDVQKRFTDAAVWIPVAQVPSVLVLNSRLTGAPASQAYLYYPWAAGLGARKG